MPAGNAAKPTKLDAHELINVVTEPTRWAILECLTRDMTSKEVAAKLGMKAALVQYHLKILHEAGLVDEFARPEHRKKYQYRLHPLVATVDLGPAGAKAGVSFRPAVVRPVPAK